MAFLKSLVVLWTCFSMFIGATAQSDNECLLAAGIDGDRQLPEFIDRDRVDDDEQISHCHQAIVASYQFHCCGNITEWGADVNRDGGMDRNEYSISFQVWRPSPTVQTDGCYSLVGENMFISKSLTNGLIRETPLPAEQISFQPGDVVGFYIEFDNSRRGVVLDTDYFAETVWYGRIDEIIETSLSSCPYPVGTQRSRLLQTLTDAAPVITVATTMVSCPTRTSQLPQASTTVLTSSTPTLSVSSFSQRASVVVLPSTPSGSETQKASTSATISPLTIGLAAGIGVLFIVVLTIVLTICVGVFAKYRISKRENLRFEVSRRYALDSKDDHDAHASQNEKSNETADEEVYYSEINVERRNFDISTKPNEAYASSVLTNENMAYGVTTNQQRNEVEENDYI